MSCTNCFNGCTEITSDKCVKYTGANIPALGIQNGDTLQFVEQTFAQFLINTLDGSGIKPNVSLAEVCTIFSNNIPVCVNCTGPTLNDLLQALIATACDLDSLITTVTQGLENLEGTYTTECLTVEETTFSNTHNVLQAVISKLCTLQSDFDDLVLTLPATYVALNGPNGIEDIIAAALVDAGLVGPVTKQYTKMIPYVAYPWFAPSLSGLFDSDGRGLDTGEYQYVYLCNGNTAPDLRGVVLAGVTDGTMLGGTMPANVNPSSSPFNPAYARGTKFGQNSVSLGIDQMPKHSHIAESVDAGHTHGLNGDLMGISLTATSLKLKTGEDFSVRTQNTSASSQADITTTLTETGNNLPHTNTQPTIGCYYIMYIPA